MVQSQLIRSKGRNTKIVIVWKNVLRRREFGILLNLQDFIPLPPRINYYNPYGVLEPVSIRESALGASRSLLLRLPCMAGDTKRLQIVLA